MPSSPAGRKGNGKRRWGASSGGQRNSIPIQSHGEACRQLGLSCGGRSRGSRSVRRLAKISELTRMPGKAFKALKNPPVAALSPCAPFSKSEDTAMVTFTDAMFLQQKRARAEISGALIIKMALAESSRVEVAKPL